MKTPNYIIYFILFTLSITTLYSQKIKVACIGNSITEGYGASSASKNYPNMLQQYLGTTDFEVKNYGASGYTLLRKGKDSSGKSVSYWDHSKYQQALNYEPDIVIIKLGTNDTKKINWDNLKDEFKTDYIDFVNSFKHLSSQPEIYVCFPIPLYGPSNSFNNDRVIREEMISMIIETAQETGSKVIDLHSVFSHKPHLSNDKVHPNDKGYGLLAYLVANAICPECNINPLEDDFFMSWVVII